MDKLTIYGRTGTSKASSLGASPISIETYMLKRFKKGEVICERRKRDCPLDCPHLHIHQPENVLALDNAGKDIIEKCNCVEAPCLLPKDAVVKRCVPPSYLTV